MYFNKERAEAMGLSYTGVGLAMRPTWDERRRSLSSSDSIWILKDDYSEEELKKKVIDKQNDSNLNPSANKKSKRIVQRCVETKKILHVWDSINQAGKPFTGYSLSSICRVLNGSRNSYAGCEWEYESKA